jgi:hypothetical protein
MATQADVYDSNEELIISIVATHKAGENLSSSPDPKKIISFIETYQPANAPSHGSIAFSTDGGNVWKAIKRLSGLAQITDQLKKDGVTIKITQH